MKSTCIPAKKTNKKKSTVASARVPCTLPSQWNMSGALTPSGSTQTCRSTGVMFRFGCCCVQSAHMCWGRLQPKLSSHFQEPCTPTLHMSCAMRNAANRLGVPVRELEFLHNTMMCYTLNLSLFSNNYRESIKEGDFKANSQKWTSCFYKMTETNSYSIHIRRFNGNVL